MKKKILIIIMIVILIIALGCLIVYFNNKDKVAVLCYHNIATAEEKSNFSDEADMIIDIENFEAQLKFLKQNNYKTLTLDEFYKWKEGKLKLPVKSVLITFDDGFLSNYYYAFPLLKKYNMNAAVFVVGEYADNASQTQWDGNLNTYMPYELIEQSKELYPNIEFASHSYGLHYENAISENTLAQMLDDAQLYEYSIGETSYLSYPFGKYNHNFITALQNRNYKMAFIEGPNKNDYRKASLNDDNFKIPRLNVSHGMELWKFALRLWM